MPAASTLYGLILHMEWEADQVFCHQTEHSCRRRGLEIFPVDINRPRFGQLSEAVLRTSTDLA